MGNYLSKPEMTKNSKSGEDHRLAFGVTGVQGWRTTMEDAHVAELRLPSAKTEDLNSFFAVYDGHGGKEIADLAGERVHRILVDEDAYHEKLWEEALKKAFIGVDEEIRADPKLYDANLMPENPAGPEPKCTAYDTGCTAVAALVTHDGRIFVANAGDSRCVLSVKGEVKPLSFDHKPQNEAESERILKAGGTVSKVGRLMRLMGDLSLSRGFGDLKYKRDVQLTAEEQILTANPDVIEHQIAEEDEFLVLACDGIWDVLTSQQAVDIIRLQVSQKKGLSEICEYICELCMAPAADFETILGTDNMSIVIVALLNGQTKDQWYNSMADRISVGYGYKTPADVPQIYSAWELQHKSW